MKVFLWAFDVIGGVELFLVSEKTTTSAAREEASAVKASSSCSNPNEQHKYRGRQRCIRRPTIIVILATAFPKAIALAEHR